MEGEGSAGDMTEFSSWLAGRGTKLMYFDSFFEGRCGVREQELVLFDRLFGKG